MNYETIKGWGLGGLIAICVLIVAIILMIVGPALTPTLVLGFVAALALARLGETPMLQTYLIVSTVTTLICALMVPAGPRKQTGVDNVMGSAVLAITLGWLIWPVAVAAACRVKLRTQ